MKMKFGVQMESKVLHASLGIYHAFESLDEFYVGPKSFDNTFLSMGEPTPHPLLFPQCLSEKHWQV